MRLLPFATAAHVEEALRLFQVSTLDAAMSGSLSGELMELKPFLMHFRDLIFADQQIESQE